MKEYEFTDYFENEVLRKRPYLNYYETKLLSRNRFFIY